jgi:hypothetical protein
MIVTPAQAGVQFKDAWIPACQTVSQLKKEHILRFCHSGLDPESSAVSGYYVSGCRIKSGMTVRIQALF